MSWLPIDISECKIWIDASQIKGVAHGAALATINNLGIASGTFSPYNGSAAYVNNSLNGKPSFAFNGNASLDFNISLGQTPITVFVVASKPNAGGDPWQRLISSGPNNSTSDYLGGGFYLMADSYANNSASSGTFAPLIISETYDLVNVNVIRIGNANVAVSNRFYGYISEVLVFSKKLSIAETKIVSTYLAEKWGFSVTGAVYPPATLALDDSNQITKYNLSTSQWEIVGIYPEDLNWDLFKTHGMTMRRIPASAINQHDALLNLLHYVPDSLTSVTGPQAQVIKLAGTSYGKLILAHGDINIKSIENIDQAKVITSEGVRIIVSANQGIDWKSFDGLSWQIINTLDLNNVSAKGMTTATFNSITKDKWTDLIGSNPETVRFGYAISDAMLVNDLQFTVDMKGAWEQQTPKVDFRALYASSSSVQIQLLSSGDYKINY